MSLCPVFRAPWEVDGDRPREASEACFSKLSVNALTLVEDRPALDAYRLWLLAPITPTSLASTTTFQDIAVFAASPIQRPIAMWHQVDHGTLTI